MKRSPMPQRKTRMPRGKPLPAVGKRGIRRAREYAAFLRSPAWNGKPDGIRWRSIVIADFTCTCGCGWRDHSETGAFLDGDHENYDKPFGQEIPGVDVKAKRRDHHRAKHWYRKVRP